MKLSTWNQLYKKIIFYKYLEYGRKLLGIEKGVGVVFNADVDPDKTRVIAYVNVRDREIMPTIYVNSPVLERISFPQVAKVVLHELVHIKQGALGCFTTEQASWSEMIESSASVSEWPEPKHFFKGKDITHTPYRERPQEIQAYRMQETLFRKVQRNLKIQHGR